MTNLAQPCSRYIASGLRGCTFAMCFLLAACSVKRDSYNTPQLALPSQYRNAPSSSQQNNINLAEWWQIFGNKELAGLIDRGLANNADVKIATIRIAQSKNQLEQIRGGFLPNVRAPFNLSTISASGGVASSWKPDLWGEQKSLVESNKYQLWRASYERDNAQSGIVSSIVASYIEYLALNDRLRLNQETASIQSNMLSTMETRASVGDGTLMERDQQSNALLNNQMQLNSLQQQREIIISNLSNLLGTLPSDLKLTEQGLDSIKLPQGIPNLPPELLLNRPDVKTAEARLLAADANIDVARARILPPLDLSAQLGTGLSLANVATPTGLVLSALASITVNIFDGKRLEKQQEGAILSYEEMVETYAKTVYQAVREVENSLIAIKLLEQRFNTQINITNTVRREWDSIEQMYKIGTVDYLTLLNTEQRYLQQVDAQQRLKVEYLSSFASLFRALGGGIKSAQAENTTVYPEGVVTSKQYTSVNWGDSSIEDGNLPSIEAFWQIELPGLYHRSTIAPAWRDLRNRYSNLMQNRIVRARLQGNVENDQPDSWYRLYIGKFSSPEQAQALCTALKNSYQRCRVVSSNWEDSQPIHLAKDKK